MCILITGGAGYIGSHTCVELLSAGYDVVVYDNMSNSSKEVISRIEKISRKSVKLVEGDIRDLKKLEATLRDYRCKSVLHFAGLKSVGESNLNPLLYYDNNVVGTYQLLRAMQNCHVNTLVFSSSATVYGNPEILPISEAHPLRAINPYGQTKLVVEKMLRDIYNANSEWRIAILRYFNPAGAHNSGDLGESPRGEPNNLMPIVAQVASGRRGCLNIWGADYPTRDGTGVRDYIHVVDLALGHVKALERLKFPQCFEVNLGTGVGYSVLEVIKAFEEVSNRTIPYEVFPRRNGDVAECYANATLATEMISWRAERDIIAMCEDHWRWQKQNPQGYI